MKPSILRPAGCPFGVAPAEWRKALVQRIDRQAAILSALVDALDAMDGDCDLEENGDREPWLGWLGTGPHQRDDLLDREIDECGPDNAVPVLDLQAVGGGQ